MNFPLLACMAGLLAAGCATDPRPVEPQEGGKPLSAWLEILGRPGRWELESDFNEQEYIAATNAIFRLDSQAVPFVKHALTVENTQRGAIVACHLLGPQATPALPALIKLSRAGNTRATWVLLDVDPETVPVIAESLSNRDPNVRFETTKVLAIAFGNHVDIRSALPALRKCLDDRDASVRAMAQVVVNQFEGKPTSSASGGYE